MGGLCDRRAADLEACQNQYLYGCKLRHLHLVAGSGPELMTYDWFSLTRQVTEVS